MAHVQSYISSITFPETIEDAWRMVDKTDIDLLLEFRSDDDEPIWWTAPRWVQEGDILLFYHTKSAKQKVAKLRKDAEQDYSLTQDEKLDVSRLLQSAVAQVDRYAGTIFGCAAASGPSEYAEEHEGHFWTPFSAPLGRIHIFDRPIVYEDFRDSVKIGQGPIKRLHEPQFKVLKELLANRNDLPTFLQNAEVAETECPDVTQYNWSSVSCAKSLRFVDEDHLRLCLLDYFLEELKDPETPVLRECRCLGRRGKGGNTADYFVKIHGAWIPVEAKLNVLSERDLLEQIAQYTPAHAFKPTQCIHKGETFERARRLRPDVCLIVDQSGVYIASSKKFLGCSPGGPIWRREELDHSLVRAIRDRVKEEGER